MPQSVPGCRYGILFEQQFRLETIVVSYVCATVFSRIIVCVCVCVFLLRAASDIPALHAELERERAINKEYALEIARLHMEVTKLSQAAPAAVSLQGCCLPFAAVDRVLTSPQVTSIAPSIIQSAPASTPSPFTPSSTAYKPPVRVKTVPVLYAYGAIP